VTAKLVNPGGSPKKQYGTAGGPAVPSGLQALAVSQEPDAMPSGGLNCRRRRNRFAVRISAKRIWPFSLAAE